MNLRYRIEQGIGLAALLLFAAIAAYLTPLRPGIVELQLTLNHDDFQRVVDMWGAGGVALFRSHFAADFVLLLLYGSYGWLFVSRTPLFAQRGAVARKAMQLQLPLAAVFDAGENVLHLSLTASTTAAPVLYPLAGVCATLKFVLITAFLFSVVRAFIGRRRHGTA